MSQILSSYSPEAFAELKRRVHARIIGLDGFN
jgi:hypothetical protein